MFTCIDEVTRVTKILQSLNVDLKVLKHLKNFELIIYNVLNLNIITPHQILIQLKISKII